MSRSLRKHWFLFARTVGAHCEVSYNLWLLNLVDMFLRDVGTLGECFRDLERLYERCIS
jgi:hypothetical protein